MCDLPLMERPKANAAARARFAPASARCFGLALLVGVAVAPCAATAGDVPFKPLPANASVRIISPRDGDTVDHVTKVVFELKNATLKPLGSTGVGQGHFLVMVDNEPVEKGYMTEERSHLQKRVYELSTPVEFGYFLTHRVTVQFVDGQKRSYGPEASHTIQNLKVRPPNSAN